MHVTNSAAKVRKVETYTSAKIQFDLYKPLKELADYNTLKNTAHPGLHI